MKVIISNKHCRLCYLFFYLLASCISKSEGEEKSNILLIISDDQRYDALGVVQDAINGRCTWLLTPNLDQLAKKGALFTHAFVTTSLCSPSRAAILTGMYNHINGIKSNQQPFTKQQISFASILQAQGFETAYFGKWHMGRQKGKRPGFDHSYSFIGQGKYFDTKFEINNKRQVTKGWTDEISTNFLIEQLKKPHPKPFCYVIGYKSPHGPWDTIPDYVHSLYEEERLTPVENMGVIPPYMEELDFKNSLDDYWKYWRTKNLNYYRSITAMDTQIGRILQTLEDEQIAENTLVIFMSDNGIYQGEHFHSDKRTAYEESIRIPLIIKYGKKQPVNAVVDELVLNIDIAPTILDFAGVQISNKIQGQSLLPLLNNPSIPWRKNFVYRYVKEPNFEIQIDLTALRTKTHKLIIYDEHEEWTELYDLENDPYEVRNLKEDQKLLDFYTQELRREMLHIGIK